MGNYIPRLLGGRHTFRSSFTAVLDKTEISEYAKVVIRERYVEMVVEFENKNAATRRLYTGLRVVVMLGGIAMPAFITVMQSLKCDHAADLFWLTLSTSLAVSVSASVMEVFDVVKSHYTYLATSEQLQTEGWSFLSLSGNYACYDSHDRSWQKLISRSERIHTLALNKYMLISSQPVRGMMGTTANKVGNFNVSDLLQIPPGSASGGSPHSTVVIGVDRVRARDSDDGDDSRDSRGGAPVSEDAQLD
jgi:hypothetical protein